MSRVGRALSPRRTPSGAPPATQLTAVGGGQPPMADPQRPCDGCAHSASGAPFPGHPSGERMCSYCTRNPEQEHVGPPPGNLSKPIDCYHSVAFKMWWLDEDRERVAQAREEGRLQGLEEASQFSPAELQEFQRQRQEALRGA